MIAIKCVDKVKLSFVVVSETKVLTLSFSKNSYPICSVSKNCINSCLFFTLNESYQLLYHFGSSPAS